MHFALLIAVDLLVDLSISSPVSSTAHLCGVVWCGAVTWALYASQHTPQPTATSLHSHVLTHIPPLLKRPLSSHSPLTASLLSPPSLLTPHPSHSHSPLPLPLTPPTFTHPSHSQSPHPLPLTPPTPTHPTHSHSSYTLYSSSYSRVVVVAQQSLTTTPKSPTWALFREVMKTRNRKGKSLMLMSCTNGPKASPLRTLTTAVVPQMINCWTLIHLNSLIDCVSLIVGGWVGESVCAIGLLACYCLFSLLHLVIMT